MYKVTLTYKDFFNDNKEATEELYFNINAFELSEIMMEFDGDGIGEYMRTVLKAGNNKEAFAVLKMLFVRGYGRRLERDGRWRFIKNPDWVAELLPSPEFEAFYLKLADDTVFASNFWNGLVSEELLARAQKVQEIEPPPEVPTGKKKFRDMTLEEQVAAMREKAAANGVELED